MSAGKKARAWTCKKAVVEFTAHFLLDGKNPVTASLVSERSMSEPLNIVPCENI